MASNNELANNLKTLSINCHSLNYLDVMADIKCNYETIFSWDIYEKLERRRVSMTDIIEKITQKQELIIGKKGIFNFNEMYYHLINCFEWFLNGDFSKALLDINYLIQTLKYIQMDTFFKPISDACFHIAFATQAYIMAFLKEDIQQILKNIKPLSNFNRIEKAMICAMKSKVFMEYPCGDNKIALEFAETARNLNDTEIYWTCIWLKAKGRKRRFDKKFILPFRDELEAAKKLSTYEKNPEFLLYASNVYKEAASALKIRASPPNAKESNSYYKLSVDLILKVYGLADNDLKLLYSCLIVLIELPKNLLQINMYIVNDIVSKLSKSQNNKICEIMGKYYLKVEKDYQKAQKCLVRSSLGGSFSSSLQLLKVECLLKSVNDFPVVKYLNVLYYKYDSPKRRLIIISQLLLYYIFIENNPKQLLHYLNIYLNQDINYIQKKYHINATFPLFPLKIKFNPKNMMNIVSLEIEKLQLFPSWDSTQKITLENVISKFAFTCNPPERNEEITETNLTCVVCMEVDSAYIVLRPCYHRCVCKTCWDVLKRNPMCPICRTVVTSILIC